MFKRLILIAVALLMLLGTAFAEGLPAFEPYAAALPAPDRPFLSLFFYLDRALLTELSLDMAVTASHDQG